MAVSATDDVEIDLDRNPVFTDRKLIQEIFDAGAAFDFSRFAVHDDSNAHAEQQSGSGSASQFERPPEVSRAS